MSAERPWGATEEDDSAIRQMAAELAAARAESDALRAAATDVLRELDAIRSMPSPSVVNTHTVDALRAALAPSPAEPAAPERCGWMQFSRFDRDPVCSLPKGHAGEHQPAAPERCIRCGDRQETHGVHHPFQPPVRKP